MEATTLYTNLFPPCRNWSDRKRKDRKCTNSKSTRGHNRRKFTKAEILAIRNSVGTDAEIARKHGVAKNTIRSIRRHDSYPEYGGPVSTTKMQWANRASQIYILRERGVSAKEIAERFGLTDCNVRKIYTREKERRKG